MSHFLVRCVELHVQYRYYYIFRKLGEFPIVESSFSLSEGGKQPDAYPPVPRVAGKAWTLNAVAIASLPLGGQMPQLTTPYVK